MNLPLGREENALDGSVARESRVNFSERIVAGGTHGIQAPRQTHADTTFEAHYTIGDLARLWRLGRETVRLLVKDEPGVLKVRMGLRKVVTRYSIPESVARRVHTKLFHPTP